MQKLTARAPLGNTGLMVPPILFGTSCLGNLYQALPDATKLDILRECFRCVAAPVGLDSAGKYGAGLALEVIGRGLRELGIPPEDALISNKLAWVRAPLLTPEPTFEKGVWADLKHDAVQRISAQGIRDCWEQGCELLGGGYRPQMVSVHDPDEYLGAAGSESERARRLEDVLGAYQALAELKAAGEVKAIGVGSKDWRVIRELAAHVSFDWVMFACSLTIMHHPAELLDFMAQLHRQGVAMINSAVFHAGFLTGGAFFDYRRVSPECAEDRPLFAWRERFFALCREQEVAPAQACVRFGLSVPGVVAVALNTGKPERVAENVASVQAEIPAALWAAMKEAGLISQEYPYLG